MIPGHIYRDTPEKTPATVYLRLVKINWKGHLFFDQVAGPKVYKRLGRYVPFAPETQLYPLKEGETWT